MATTRPRGGCPPIGRSSFALPSSFVRLCTSGHLHEVVPWPRPLADYHRTRLSFLNRGRQRKSKKDRERERRREEWTKRDATIRREVYRRISDASREGKSLEGGCERFSVMERTERFLFRIYILLLYFFYYLFFSIFESNSFVQFAYPSSLEIFAFDKDNSNS